MDDFMSIDKVLPYWSYVQTRKAKSLIKMYLFSVDQVVNIFSLSGSSFLFRNFSGGDILEYNVKDDTKELFLEASVLVSTSIREYTENNYEKIVLCGSLFVTNTQILLGVYILHEERYNADKI